MKKYLAIIIFMLCFLLVSGLPTSSFAVLEERDASVFGVGAITYDSETGLEWLDITETFNKSFNYVSTQFGPGGEFEGFRHATLAEVEELMIHAGIPDIDSRTTANFEPTLAFQALVGFFDDIVEGFLYHVTKGPTADNMGSDHHRNAFLEAWFVDNTGYVNAGTSSVTPDWWSGPSTGHWLVRTASPNGVYIDIMPGKCPNALDINQAEVLELAIPGTWDFDVSNIDPETIRLTRGGSQVAPLRSKVKDRATPYDGELCNCHELRKDGLRDLVLKFDAQAVIELLGLGEHVGETIPLSITGNLNDGVSTPIEGQDCVWLITEDKPLPFGLEVGGFSVHALADLSYYIVLTAFDPNQIIESVEVSGPYIDGKAPLTDYGSGNWAIDPYVLGQDPPTPPLTYTFYIKSGRKTYTDETVIERYIEEFITNPSPSGIVGGDITFTWTGISLPGVQYFVELNYESGDGFWSSDFITDNFINYTGPTLSSGSSWIYSVWAIDSYGNKSVVNEEFVYGGTQEVYTFERMWPELQSPWYFSWPTDVATDSDGHVYVSDTLNNRIQKFTTDGQLVAKWPIVEFQEFELEWPVAIAVGEDGFVYVVAWVKNGGYSSILKLSSSGQIVGKIGNYAGQFSSGWHYPLGIDLDNVGNIYVANGENHRIDKLDPDGTLIETWGSLGSGDGQFDDPTGIAVDRQNNYVYILDTRNLRIQKFNTDGDYQAQWECIDSLPAYAAFGVAVDKQGYVYVRNTTNGEIRKYSNNGTLVQTLQDSFDFGSYGVAIDSSGFIYSVHYHASVVEKIDPTGTYSSMWSSSGTEDGFFSEPVDVALDSNGNVYVMDRVNFRIQKFDALGNFITKWNISNPGDSIAIDKFDELYVTGGGCFVRKYNSNGVFLTEWGSCGSDPGQFSPDSKWVATDSNGYIYVVDPGNDCVQKFTYDGTFITKWGSSGTGNGQFLLPFGIDVDNNGYVYVIDSDQHNVQKFTNTGDFVDKWDQGFSAPRGIAIDEFNHVYVANTQNSKIIKLSSNGELITEFGNPGSDPGSMASPNGIEIGSTGRIYVSDTNNNRIQVFATTTPIDPHVSSTSGQWGDTISQPGWGFTPFGTAELHFRRPDGSASPTTTEPVRGDGTYDHYWFIPGDAQVGTWEYYGVDDTTEISSESVTFTVNE
ncbi:6-bladed beta-propeller [Thermodesulfobacteriota bacterium]